MTKRAIVLGGGGSRGPYQIGVWGALRELDIDYSIVTGSSVGALNGALMVQGDYQVAKRLWESLTTADVITEASVLDAADPARTMRAMLRAAVEHGGLDISPLEERVYAAIDEEKIRQSPIEYGLITTRYPMLKPIQLLKDEIPPGDLANYLLASSAWFPFFKRRTIDGADYIDGAYADNLPAELAARCGATEILAVDLQGTGIVHTFRRNIPVRHIRSHWRLGDMLVFDPATSRRNIQLGYQDALKVYGRLEGSAYAFPLGDTRKNVVLLRRALADIHRRTGVTLFKERERMPKIQDMLRYRSSDHRFLRQRAPGFTLGQAVTTAAEITGELLQLPPDRIWRLRSFNKRMLEQAAGLRHPLADSPEPGLFYSADKPSGRLSRRSRAVLFHLLDGLRKAYRAKIKPDDTFFGLATVSPIEFVAANYLLALELHYTGYV